MTNDVKMLEITTDDSEKIAMPVYVPTIEETFKASGAHRQAAK